MALNSAAERNAVGGYTSVSPDEGALVSAAAGLGIVLETNTDDGLELSILGSPAKYTKLAVLEFSSDRKRMSIIVRGADGKCHIHCKGADDVLYGRLSPEDSMLASVQEHVEIFAAEGLRTLVYASREMPDAGAAARAAPCNVTLH